MMETMSTAFGAVEKVGGAAPVHLSAGEKEGTREPEVS
jgi:hypothetical protein